MAQKLTDSYRLKILSERVGRYIRVRWTLLILLSASGLISQYISERFSHAFFLNLFISVGVLLLNGFFQFIARRQSKQYAREYAVAMAIIFADILAATFLIYSNGGIESRTIIIYAIPLVAAGAFFSSKVVYLWALLSSILYDAVILLDYFKLIPRQVINTEAIHANFGSVLVATIFYPVTFFMVTFVSVYVLTLLNEREEELSSVSEKLKYAQSLSKTGSWEWNMITDKLEWSDEMFKIYGISQKNTPMGLKKAFELIYPDDRKKVEERLNKALAERADYEIEYRIKPKGKNMKYIYAKNIITTDDNNKVTKLHGVVQEITDRKIAENELQESTSELEILNSLMVDRELKMIELKQQIADIKRPK